jgi:hypothetical protein
MLIVAGSICLARGAMENRVVENRAAAQFEGYGFSLVQ